MADETNEALFYENLANEAPSVYEGGALRCLARSHRAPDNAARAVELQRAQVLATLRLVEAGRHAW